MIIGYSTSRILSVELLLTHHELGWGPGVQAASGIKSTLLASLRQLNPNRTIQSLQSRNDLCDC